MKDFRIWNWIILIAGAVLVLLTGIWEVLPLIPFLADVIDSLQANHVVVRWIVRAVGVLDILFALYLFAMPGKFIHRKKDFIVQQTENGELRISVIALKKLVQQCVDSYKEVHLTSLHIFNGRRGITVSLSISLSNNIIIPLAVSALQKRITQHLLTSSGVEVKNVKVAVETTKEATQDSPYQVSTDTPMVQEAAAAPRDKKPPIHQRLFKRDQEPATLPEAPEAPVQPALVQEDPAPETAPQPEETPAQDNTENAVQAQEEENND